MQETAAEKKEPVAQKPLRPTAAPELTPEERLEQRKSLALLETYLRLRNGVTPSTDLQTKKNLLQDFNLTAGQVREANYAIARRASPGCQRFTRVYNGILGQASFHYQQMLRERPLNGDIMEMTKARLEILQFFERTMFGLVLANAEAGQSELDDGARQTCPIQDRSAWSTLLLKAHQKLEVLHSAVLGEASALAVSDEMSKLHELKVKHRTSQTGKKVAFIAAEVVASIAIWEKGLSPALRLAVGGATITPMGRLITLGAGAVYIMGWVAFDRTMREHFTFLQNEPEIVSRNSISTWNGAFQLAEQLLIAELASPPLYFAYVELLSLMRKQAAYQFLTENQEFLTRVEAEFGSIEKAVESTKEVLREEPTNTNRRHGDPGEPMQLGAAG